MEQTNQSKYLKAVHRRNNIRRGFFLAALLALSVTHFAVFWVYINIQTVIMTFQRFDITTNSYVFNGFTAYEELFKNVFLGEDPAMFRAFLNTFHAWAINTIIFPLALITAYAFYKKVYGEKVFRVIFYLPSIISIVVLTMAYRYMFYTETGPVAQFFALFGYKPEWLSTALNSRTIWPLIYVFCILTGLSTNVLLMSGAMLRIPVEITESIELEGCGFFRELFSFTVPLIMPTLTAWALMIVTSVYGFTMAPMLIALTGGESGKAYTLPWYMFDSVQSGRETSLLSAATVGIIFSVMMFPLVFIVRWLSNKFTPDVSF